MASRRAPTGSRAEQKDIETKMNDIAKIDRDSTLIKMKRNIAVSYFVWDTDAAQEIVEEVVSIFQWLDELFRDE